MKKVTILGSTGSIGTQALDVIRQNKDKFQVTALACGSNTELLSQQIEEFQPRLAVTARPEDARALSRKHPGVEFLWGEAGLISAAEDDSDVLLNALMGMRGLVPTYHAIMAGKDIALANKETLVAGGELIMEAAGRKGVKLLPVDSEHSAVFQCLAGNRDKKIKRILLTASGGPFRGFTREELEEVTLEQALRHPKWTMGQKITIDSATMMNKGLEVIEARWLFDVPLSRIEILVHPQSIVHSAVQYSDNSIIAQLGVPDMRIPIQYALTYPARVPGVVPELDFTTLKLLTFDVADEETFRCLAACKKAIKKGGLGPCAANGANEEAVKLFLEDKIGFLDIGRLVEAVVDSDSFGGDYSLADVYECDRMARAFVRAHL